MKKGATISSIILFIYEVAQESFIPAIQQGTNNSRHISARKLVPSVPEGTHSASWAFSSHVLLLIPSTKCVFSGLPSRSPTDTVARHSKGTHFASCALYHACFTQRVECWPFPWYVPTGCVPCLVFPNCREVHLPSPGGSNRGGLSITWETHSPHEALGSCAAPYQE